MGNFRTRRNMQIVSKITNVTNVTNRGRKRAYFAPISS